MSLLVLQASPPSSTIEFFSSPCSIRSQTVMALVQAKSAAVGMQKLLWQTTSIRSKAHLTNSFKASASLNSFDKLPEPDSVKGDLIFDSGKCKGDAILDSVKNKGQELVRATVLKDSLKVEIQQGSQEWLALRKNRLTCSLFSTALGFWAGRRVKLWEEKAFEKQGIVANAAMSWGMSKEEVAVERYKWITGYNVQKFGFRVYLQEWLGASPDGLVKHDVLQELSEGILEVKCPYNRGMPEKGLPWDSVPYYYMPQIQGLMEIFDREWLDLYCWTPNASTVFRVHRDKEYWAMIYEPLKEFWWENVVPAKESRLVHGDSYASQFKPSPKHKDTKEIIAQSREIAKNGYLLCKEVRGQVEYFQKP